MASPLWLPPRFRRGERKLSLSAGNACSAKRGEKSSCAGIHRIAHAGRKKTAHRGVAGGDAPEPPIEEGSRSSTFRADCYWVALSRNHRKTTERGSSKCLGAKFGPVRCVAG